MVNYPSIKERAELSLKEKWRLIIFEADTQEGRRFDILLLWAIVISVLTLMIDSVPTIHAKYAIQLKYIEYFFTDAQQEKAHRPRLYLLVLRPRRL